MKWVLLVLELVLVALPAGAEELSMKELKALSPERCLSLPADELATRCPLIAGRHLTIGNQRVAVLDRVDQRKGTFWCDEGGNAWRCRRIVVLDRELRGARKRNPQAFITTTELLRAIATAPAVKLGDEFGALFAPSDRPKTCLDLPSHGCVVQPVRLRGKAPDRHGTPVVRRRLWLLEDADGTTLQCSDQQLRRCDELTAAGWLALVVTLRPSALAPPEPAPEFDLPDLRTDHQKGGPIAVGGREAADTPAGALDPWVKPKVERARPPTPPRNEVKRAADALAGRGHPCVPKEQSSLIVDVVFSGEGNLVSLTAAGVPPSDPAALCLTQIARKIEFPRFAGAVYRLKTVVMGGPPSARNR